MNWNEHYHCWHLKIPKIPHMLIYYSLHIGSI
ncbi:hypothetical protein BLA29_013278 [Euroglyphus maynei]|uniref:Uncharacterized protein n=1 Tax=Euroglyphus maynei TaxID=6958 RepID=A0A1Y3B9V4_EURMA|nr:hypothetical protein BLA29_013278 [Euroglyphus maynei]